MLTFRSSLLLVALVGCTYTPPEGTTTGGHGTSDTAVPPLPALEHFIYTPLVRQSTDYTCGVAALQSVLHYYGVPDELESTVAERLGSDPDFGTSYLAMVEYAEGLGFQVTTERDMTIDKLAARIEKQQPVILAIQAWAEDPTIDWKETYEHGHYVVATGYDAERVYFMDPWTRASYTYINRAQLEDRWHDVDEDGTLEHFGIIIDGRNPAFDFERVIEMP
jgi:predicted double-glycine peptidase